MLMRTGWWRASARGLLTAIAVTALGASRVSGAMLDFNVDALQPAGASVSYAGGGAALVGVGIGVDSVVGIDTPLLSYLPIEIFDETSTGSVASLASSEGKLSFATGGYLGNNSALGWEFAGGGYFEIRGIIDFNGDAVIDAADQAALAAGGGVLLSGTFADTVKVNLFPVGFVVLSGGLQDVYINSSLAALFGIPAAGPTLEGGINLSFMIPALKQAGQTFASTRVFSGDVATVPELGSVSLVGAVSLLVAVSGWRRRKRAAA